MLRYFSKQKISSGSNHVSAASERTVCSVFPEILLLKSKKPKYSRKTEEQAWFARKRRLRVYLCILL